MCYNESMLGILLLVVFALYLDFLFPIFGRRKAKEPQHSEKYDQQMKKLWSAAQDSMRDHKPLRAEKALLTILKFDEKNAAAYNRLGILYAKGQKFEEAIECFEIAQSLDNNPSSLHNVGLIYLETGNYEKAAMAFRQALEIERDLPARFIALAKAEEKLGRLKAAIESLEEAYKLDHSINTLRQILAIHELNGDSTAIADTTARIEAQISKAASSKTPKPARKSTAKRPKTVEKRSPRAATTPAKMKPATTATRPVARRAPVKATTPATRPTVSRTRSVPAPRVARRVAVPVPQAANTADARARADSIARAASARAGLRKRI